METKLDEAWDHVIALENQLQVQTALTECIRILERIRCGETFDKPFYSEAKVEYKLVNLLLKRGKVSCAPSEFDKQIISQLTAQTRSMKQNSLQKL
jgi:hypothetical protein